METLGRLLHDTADQLAQEVMADWDQLGSREPWHRIPQGLDQDHLPDLIRRLASTALLTFFDRDERSALAWIAVLHGEHRFQAGVTEEIIGREYELLRWALWRRLKRAAASEAASGAIIRLDSALGFAQGGSLRGFHRAAIEGSGDWPAAVERYIDEWSFHDGGRRS